MPEIDGTAETMSWTEWRLRQAEDILRTVLDPEADATYSALVGDMWDVDARVVLTPEQVAYMRSLGLKDAG